jgi:hypothetical protein
MSDADGIILGGRRIIKKGTIWALRGIDFLPGWSKAIIVGAEVIVTGSMLK